MSFHDPASLRTTAYADSGNLAARQAIYRYRAPGPTLHEELVGAVDWSTTNRLADVGCGNSIYLDKVATKLPPEATVVGIDLSPGMLADARHPTGRIAADVQQLPLPTGSIDAVLALHMLYHVPDMAQGVRELRRVVRRGGTVLVATNGSGHLRELGELVGQPSFGGLSRLDLDAAEALLGAEFDDVARHDLPNALEVPEAEPVLAYLRSTISLGVDPAHVDEAAAKVEAVIEAEGVFRITMHPWFLVCR
jgi:SAM-dependent methyltransferase